MARQRQKLSRFYFTVDLRSAGLFRILLAGVLIWHWADRWHWINVLYSADGVLPASLLAQLRGIPESVIYFTPFQWLDPWPLAVRGFFLLILGCYVMFLVGYRTRLFAALSLVGLASLVHRNPYAVIGADFVLGSLLVWAQLLPLGQRFSIDAVRKALRDGVELPSEPADETRITAPLRAPRTSTPLIAAFGVAVQIGLIYLMTALWKTVPMAWAQSESWREGSAIYFTLHMEQSLYPLAEWVRAGPVWFLRLLSYGTLAVEFAALPMILSPWGQPWARRVVLLLLAGLHLGIAVTLDAGLFSYVMVAGFAILLRDDDWRWIRRLIAPFSRPATVYYDDSCGVCTRTCEILTACDRFGRLSFIGSSDVGAYRHDIPEGLTEKTVVVFDDRSEKMYTRASAMARAVAGLPLPFHVLRLAAIPGLRWLSNIGYDLFAKNRRRVSRWLGLAACGIGPLSADDDDGPAKTSGRGNGQASLWSQPINYLAAMVLAAFLLNTLTENVGPMTAGAAGRHGSAEETPSTSAALSRLNVIANYPGAIQRWDMFSPDPPRFDHWWVADAQRADGGRVDLLTARPPDFVRQPSRRECLYPCTWGAYLKYGVSNVRPGRLELATRLQRELCRHLAEQYQRSTGKKLVKLDLYNVRLRTPDLIGGRAIAAGPAQRLSQGVLGLGVQPVIEAEHPRRPTMAMWHGTYDCQSGRFESKSKRRSHWWVSRYPSGEKRSEGRAEFFTQRPLGVWNEWDERGGRRTGKYEDGRCHGRWEYYHPQGWLHSAGPFAHGKQSGVWERYFSTGRIDTRSTLVDALQHGESTTWYPDGGIKQRGEYRRGRQHGDWVFWDQYGLQSASGRFENGLRHGPWKTLYRNGEVSEGGEYRHGVQSGPWHTFYDSGEVRSEVTFDRGMRQGRFAQYYKDGRIEQQGEYQDDLKTGKWEQFHANGRPKLTATFARDLRHGPFQQWSEDGKPLEQGQFDHGSATGPWTFWHDNGRVARHGRFHQGHKEGRWSFWYNNGEWERSGVFENDHDEGPWRLYHATGELLAVYTLREGRQHGPATVRHPNGGLAERGEYRDNQRHGRWGFWYENGNLNRAGHFEEGEETGLWKLYYENGALLATGHFRHARRHGHWTFFDRDGGKSSDGHYVDGRETERNHKGHEEHKGKKGEKE